MVSNVHGLGPVAGWSAFRVHRVRAGNVWGGKGFDSVSIAV